MAKTPTSYVLRPPQFEFDRARIKWTGSLQEFKDAYFEREIAIYEQAWAAGRFPALLDALALCREHERPLPLWVSEAATAELEAVFKSRSKGRRGRTARLHSEEQTNFVHRVRWEWVSLCMDYRAEEKEQGFKITRAQVFEWASEQLIGTIAQGSPEAIEESYDYVRKAIKNGEGARFYVSRDAETYFTRSKP
jgi:hypothetical protein